MKNKIKKIYQYCTKCNSKYTFESEKKFCGKCRIKELNKKNNQKIKLTDFMNK